jgi:hypothetical protein
VNNPTPYFAIATAASLYLSLHYTTGRRHSAGAFWMALTLAGIYFSVLSASRP